MNFSDYDLRTALGYFSIKAMRECQTQEAWDKLAARTAETKAFEENYNNEFIVLDESDLRNICCVIARINITTEMNYLKIDSAYRVKLEQIEDLKKGFHFTKNSKKILSY